jgi:diadenosine tetraphosphatase ApaH/serine/threonine PP2A family protein phosphatase
LIFHGGDLADAGSSPVEIVDRIRALGWPGVIGNTDEMLARPETLEDFAGKSSAPSSLWNVIREMAAATRQALGDERIAWLGQLPRMQTEGPMALLHASPESTWKAPAAEASDAELESIYSPLGQPLVIYGHIHRPYVRSVSKLVVANTGSVGLSYDGDRRAAYLLLDNSVPSIRRVEYDVDKEIKALAGCGLPHSEWIAKTLLAGRPQLP